MGICRHVYMFLKPVQLVLTLHFENKTWVPPEDYVIILKGLPEESYWDLSSEDLKVEYSRGCLYIHSPASLRHEKIFGLLFRIINDHLERHDLGEMLGSRVAIHLPNGHRPEPDLTYFLPNSYSLENDAVYSGIPEWIIEIVSPGTEPHDLGDKLRWYQDARIPEIWYIFQTPPKIIQFVLEGEDYIKETIETGSISPKKIAGLRIDLSWLQTFPKITEIA